MQTMTSPNLSDLVAQAKESAQMGRERLLRSFDFVPDEKLNYSPAETARTSLQIVAHCGAANTAFATIIRGEDLQMPSDPVEAARIIRQSGMEIKTREEAVRLLEESTDQVLAALDKVTPEMLDTSPMSPFGPFPFVFWMNLPGMHMNGHVSQLEYIQTIWGDLETH